MDGTLKAYPSTPSFAGQLSREVVRSFSKAGRPANSSLPWPEKAAPEREERRTLSRRPSLAGVDSRRMAEHTPDPRQQALHRVDSRGHSNYRSCGLVRLA